MPGDLRRGPAAPAPVRVERRPSLAASVHEDEAGVRIRDVLWDPERSAGRAAPARPALRSGPLKEDQALWAWAAFSRFARRDLRRLAAFLWMMFRLAALSSSALVSLKTCIAFSSPPEMAERVFFTN